MLPGQTLSGLKAVSQPPGTPPAAPPGWRERVAALSHESWESWRTEVYRRARPGHFTEEELADAELAAYLEVIHEGQLR